MTLTPDAGMLFARLQLAAPAARSFVVAPARESPRAHTVGESLAAAMAAAGHRVRWLDLAGTSTGALPEGAEDLSLLESELGDVQRARQALDTPGAYTVVCGGGLLENPRTLVLCAAADVVVVVVTQGRTARADLTQIRRDVEGGGGRLLGAVLLR